jgi:hypothetical protein
MANKQTIHFDIEYFQGISSVGCSVISSLAVEIEFSKMQIDFMRQLISQVNEELYSEGLMPLLEDSAPILYAKIDNAARSAIFDFLVINGIRQGDIFPNEDECQLNYVRDVKSGKYEFFDGDLDESDEPPTEEEIQEMKYNAWHDQEMARFQSESLEWIRSRYNVDDQIEEPHNIVYICKIPVELLP